MQVNVISLRIIRAGNNVNKNTIDFFFISPFSASIRLVDYPKSIFAMLSVALSLNTKLEDTSVKNWLAVRSAGS